MRFLGVGGQSGCEEGQSTVFQVSSKVLSWGCVRRIDSRNYAGTFCLLLPDSL